MTLKNIKEKKIWYLIIKYFVKNVYIFIWRYIFNLKGRMLYFLWFVKKKKFFSLKNDFLVIKDDPDFINLSKKIYKNCLELNLQDIKKKMLMGDLVSKNISNSGKKTYTIDLYNELNYQTKKEIIDFVSSEKIISSAAKHLGIFPIISRIKLNYNIINHHQKRGAMLWHRDGFGFKSFDIFLSITDVDENNGPLYVSMTNNELGVFYRLQGEENKLPGESGKINDMCVTSKELDKNSTSNIGRAGTALMIDSYSTYHKGGNCRNNDRIILRLSFQTCDAIDLKNQFDNFLFFESIDIEKTSSFFLKHLFFFRSKFFFRRSFNKTLLKFYKILQFYQKI